MTYKHPSGLNLSPIPGDEVLDIDTNDELFGDATADDIGSIAGEMAELLLTGKRENSLDWMIIAAKLLTKYYAAHRLKIVATYDRSAEKITTRNSFV